MNTPHKFTFLTFIACSVIGISCENRPSTNAESSFAIQLDSLWSDVPDFSGVLLIADQGRPVYHRAVGFLNFETNEPLDTTSIFELASVSKQFTATAILMLMEEGKLSLDDPLEKFVPGLPYPGITLRHLLQHTSGLPDYQNVMDLYWDKTKVAGNEDNIEYLKRYHPEPSFEPGAKYEYSNTGYMLLASVVEKVSATDFIQFSRDRIFSPCKMASTDIRTLQEKKTLRNMALGHIYVEEKHRYVRADSFPAFNYAIWLGNRKGPGRISSTSTDLLRWDQALYKEVVLRPETLEKAFEPALLNDGSFSNYGFGWVLEQDSTMGKIVRHSGDNPGYKTHIVRYLDKNKTIVLLCNNAHPKFEEILSSVERIVSAP